MKLEELFDLATSRLASDIHLVSGEAPRLRIEGDLVALDESVDLASLLEPLLSSQAAARLGAGLPVERTVVHGDFVFNGLVFRVGDAGLSATFRILPKEIPPFEQIMEGAEALFRRIVETRRGLVLVVGPTGSGKWTTVCSLIETINQEKASRIFVATTQSSFLFESKHSLVTHLRVGQDVEGFVQAMEIAHRADPDVIALEDIPTQEALRQALLLADTGHLVIATLHARTPVEAIHRLLESAGPEEGALRRALAENLVAVTAQRLLPRRNGRGRVPLYEWISNGPAVREALLGGDLAEAQANDPESRTLEAAKAALFATGKVETE